MIDGGKKRDNVEDGWLQEEEVSSRNSRSPTRVGSILDSRVKEKSHSCWVLPYSDLIAKQTTKGEG